MTVELAMDISDRQISHICRLVHDLAAVGWRPTHFPSNAKLLSNRQLIELRELHSAIQVRISVFKVGDRGEPHRLDERRIEITTTFASGMSRLRNWTDVVLGYDFANDVYVGLDPRRLNLGGKTHNASTSVDPLALIAASRSHILIRPRETPSLGVEYQAIFRPERLGEYLFNYKSIHEGLYRGDGLFSGLTRKPRKLIEYVLPSNSCGGEQLVLIHENPTTAKVMAPTQALVEAYESSRFEYLGDLSPDQLDAILRKCKNVGHAGEHFVYQHERRRLHKAGRGDLIDKIDWVSQRTVSKGYDIKSYEVDGSPRHIEVKATIGKSPSFFMSSNEWNVATRMRGSYWLYRVVQSLDRPRITCKLQDPKGAEDKSAITRLPDGWLVTIL